MGDFLDKIENISLFLWILLIPTQLGKHFWPEWSHVIGVRSDYLGPILYLNDLVWGVWLGSKLFGSLKSFKLLKIKSWLNFENILTIGFVGLNILVAGNKGVAVYRWARLMQGIITFNNIKFQKSNVKNKLIWIIPCWIGLESFLGLAQIVKGESLQGIFYWLGERRFTLTTIGIAQMSIFGEGLVRAYGTFSHPNSLAGFLLVVTMLWNKISKNKKIGYWMVVWLGVMGIIISGSRTVWGLLIIQFLMSNFQFLMKEKKRIFGYGAVGAGLFLLVLAVVGINYRTSDFVGGWDSDSFSKRISLNLVALKMWKENYMLGVGAGNFVAKLPEYQRDSKFYWLQPVHNIFLLLGTELGVLGIILIIKMLITNYKLQITKKNWLIFGVVAVTGMVDHYWITLPQNFWLLIVVLGIL